MVSQSLASSFSAASNLKLRVLGCENIGVCSASAWLDPATNTFLCERTQFNKKQNTDVSFFKS